MENTSSASGENLLKNVYLFKLLGAEEIERINSICKVESYLPGDEVFNQGDTADSMFIIKFGSVKIQKAAKTGELPVAALGTGSHFGEMPFVDGEKRSASVMVAEPTELVRIYYKDLRNVIDTNPAIAMKVYKSLAHFLCGRLRITTTDLSFAREKNLRHF